MRRRKFSAPERLRILLEHKSECAICGKLIFPGDPFHIDHTKPLWLLGRNTPKNIAPVHTECHAGKTAREATDRAKSDRIRDRHQLHLERMRMK